MKKTNKKRAKLMFWAWIAQGINLVVVATLYAIHTEKIMFAGIGFVLAVLSISTAKTRRDAALLKDDLSTFTIALDYIFCFGTSIVLAILAYTQTTYLTLCIMIPVLLVEVIVAFILGKK